MSGSGNPHDLHESETEDLASALTEDVVPRDTHDLPPNVVKHSSLVHSVLEKLLEDGVEFYSPAGERSTTIEEIAETHERYGRVLGPKQKPPEQPEQTGECLPSRSEEESEET